MVLEWLLWKDQLKQAFLAPLLLTLSCPPVGVGVGSRLGTDKSAAGGGQGAAASPDCSPRGVTASFLSLPLARSTEQELRLCLEGMRPLPEA